jgi:sensor histidine kinase regulating citrate/malate metabolism
VLAHERLEHVFTWQEERSVTRNLTLHYKRVMYLLEPSERSRAAARRQVLVRETEEGAVVIEHKGGRPSRT